MIHKQDNAYFSDLMGFENIEDLILNAATDETFAELLLFKQQQQVILALTANDEAKELVPSLTQSCILQRSPEYPSPSNISPEHMSMTYVFLLSFAAAVVNSTGNKPREIPSSSEIRKLDRSLLPTGSMSSVNMGRRMKVYSFEPSDE